MTPAAQYDLPWTVRSIMMNEARDRILREEVVPILKDAVGEGPPRHRIQALEPCVRSIVSPDGFGARLSLTGTIVRGTDWKQVVATIDLHPDLLRAYGRHPNARSGAPVARTMLRIVERILEARLVDDPFEPSDPTIEDGRERLRRPDRMRIDHAARLMRRHLGLTPSDPRIDVVEEAAFVWANPLGDGGVAIPRDPTRSKAGRLIDVSPDLCLPGPIVVEHMETRSSMRDRSSSRVRIGGYARSEPVGTHDPLAMLRMEAERPWNPCAVRIEPGRLPNALKNAS